MTNALVGILAQQQMLAARWYIGAEAPPPSEADNVIDGTDNVINGTDNVVNG